MILQANFVLDQKTKEALEKAKHHEPSPMGLHVLEEIGENAKLAKEEKMPLCQDTGTSIFMVKWGQECILEQNPNANPPEAGQNPITIQSIFDEAVRQSHQEGYLRKSVLRDPVFDRKNTGDNTPAFIHLEMAPGNTVEIHYMAKGAGCENGGQMVTLNPSNGLTGIKKFVLKVGEEAGASSCPPWILGIGVGGTFDSVSALAKKALFRDIGSEHTHPKYTALEKEILDQVNHLGIGPQGLGGKTTALAVFIEAFPCHAASLPVAVNIQCHSNRKGRVVI